MSETAEASDNWISGAVPRGVLLLLALACSGCCLFSVAVGLYFDRLSPLETVALPLAGTCYLLIGLGYRFLQGHLFDLLGSLFRFSGGGLLFSGLVDGLIYENSNVAFYVGWMPIFYGSIFYLSAQRDALRWSLIFLGTMTVVTLVLIIVGPLPFSHDNVLLVITSLFMNLAAIAMINLITRFREELAAEQSRSQALHEVAEELRQEKASAEKARQHAEAADRAKSIFLASMSHELRTPLNAILGFSEMMTQQVGGELSQRYQSYAGDIHQSAEHLLGQINDVLDVSRIELGDTLLHEDEVDLGNLVESCLRLASHASEIAKVSVSTRTAQGLPTVRADSGKLKQIVSNLVANGIKFNRPGGIVTIACELSEDGGLSISVIDDGIGMNAEEAKQALIPFHQVANGFIRPYEGVGLGLSIARSLVEQHDGRLNIESEKGTGTTVTIWLPPERMIPYGSAASVCRTINEEPGEPSIVPRDSLPLPQR